MTNLATYLAMSLNHWLLMFSNLFNNQFEISVSKSATNREYLVVYWRELVLSWILFLSTGKLYDCLYYEWYAEILGCMSS